MEASRSCAARGSAASSRARPRRAARPSGAPGGGGAARLAGRRRRRSRAAARGAAAVPRRRTRRRRRPAPSRGAHGPWSGVVADGRLHGRGARGHEGGGRRRAACRRGGPRRGGRAGDVVSRRSRPRRTAAWARSPRSRPTRTSPLRDPRADAAFDVACAQAGALTFTGVVPGVAAHAALRLEGVSAIDRYVAVHARARRAERRAQRGRDAPLMRELALPYPLSVGRLATGRWSCRCRTAWSSRARVGVPVGADPAAVAGERRGRGRRGLTRGRDRVDGRRVPSRRDAGRRTRSRSSCSRRGATSSAALPGGRRVLRRRHAPLLRPRHPMRDGRDAGTRAAHAVDEYVAVRGHVALARTLVRVMCASGDAAQRRRRRPARSLAFALAARTAGIDREHGRRRRKSRALQRTHRAPVTVAMRRQVAQGARRRGAG